jgi:hypothetical protein
MASTLFSSSLSTDIDYLIEDLCFSSLEAGSSEAKGSDYSICCFTIGYSTAFGLS